MGQDRLTSKNAVLTVCSGCDRTLLERLDIGTVYGLIAAEAGHVIAALNTVRLPIMFTTGPLCPGCQGGAIYSKSVAQEKD